jgi:hypothetical protein
LASITRTAPGFVAAGLPALDDLASVARTGTSALPPIKPVVRDLRKASQRAAPLSTDLDRFLINLRDRGAIEGLLSVFYSVATMAAGYDETSHITSLYIKAFPQCLVSSSAAGCKSTYNQPGNGTIPPDDPSCGPQDGAIWQPPTNCVSHDPGTGRAQRQRRDPARRPDRSPATAKPPAGETPASETKHPDAPAPDAPRSGVGGLLDYLLEP